MSVSWSGELEAHLAVPIGLVPSWCYALRSAGIEGIAEITPGSQTLQIRLSDNADIPAVLARACAFLSDVAEPHDAGTPRVVEIPICYDSELAPDLSDIAGSAGCSPSDAADLHAEGAYTVRLLGFSPGFPYIDGLPKSLHTPRHDTPRARVRPGSVGIAGTMTGIYPQATPGGWRVIGATPLRLFAPHRDPPALLAPGNRIRFRRIDRRTFDAMESIDTHDPGYAP